MYPLFPSVGAISGNWNRLPKFEPRARLLTKTFGKGMNPSGLSPAKVNIWADLFLQPWLNKEKEKKNSEFKPGLIPLSIDLVSFYC